MAGRKPKATVDYFPHFAKHRKTVPVLKSRYGNDGYAFWFTLLEILCNSDGMFFDLNKSSEFEFLLSETKVDGDMAMAILQTLTNLEAIDKDCIECGIVYSPNLVEGVREAFSRRVSSLPNKERVFEYINAIYADRNAVKRTLCQQKFNLCNENATEIGDRERDRERERDKRNTIGRSDDTTQVDLNSKFDEYWKVRPTRTPHSDPKKPALSAFIAACKRGADPDDIIDGAKRYKRHADKHIENKQMIAQAQTWIRQERWTDQYDAPNELSLDEQKERYGDIDDEMDVPF